MGKERLLYVSPFPPQKSGISDYSEVLVYALKDYFDITLLIDNYKLSDPALYRDFEVIVYKKEKVDFDRYKYIIYNIGNNPYFHSYIYKLCLEHPGMVILHDCVLYYLVVGYYETLGQVYSKIYEIGGVEAVCTIKQALRKEKKGLLEYKEIAEKLPLNSELAQSGNKIMVHSEYARNMISPYIKNASMLRKINLLKQTKDNTKIIEKQKLFGKYGIPMDAIVISSFGYIAQTKLNDQVCEAVRHLAAMQSGRICYIMVGEGNYVDQYIDNSLIFKTGYVDLDEFNSFLQYSDVVANLRYPSMGETSAAMIRVMEYGKPCIIVSDAWFAELPKDCVVALEPDEIDDLESELKKLLIEEDYRKDLGMKAQKYVEVFHSSERISKEIIDFMKL